MKDGAVDTFKDNESAQRRALVEFKDLSRALVESREKLTLNQFAEDLYEMSVSDALYTDMGNWDEGWYREQDQIKTIGLLRGSTERQTNWLVFGNCAFKKPSKDEEDRWIDPQSAHKWLEKHRKADKAAQENTESPAPPGICSVAFSPDGKMLAACMDDGSTVVIELGTGKELLHTAASRLEFHVYSAASVRDGKTIACNIDKMIKLL